MCKFACTSIFISFGEGSGIAGSYLYFASCWVRWPKAPDGPQLPPPPPQMALWGSASRDPPWKCLPWLPSGVFPAGPRGTSLSSRVQATPLQLGLDPIEGLPGTSVQPSWWQLCSALLCTGMSPAPLETPSHSQWVTQFCNSGVARDPSS